MAQNGHDQNDFAIDEEDDCVIFKGSPLYTSLLQSGSLAEELEIEQTGIATPLEHFSKETSKQNTSVEKSSITATSLIRRWRIICEQLKSWFLPDLSPIYKKNQEAVVKNLSASSCLDEDDRDFLHFYIKSTGATCDSHKTLSTISRLALHTILCLISFSAYQFLSLGVARQQLPWNTVLLAAIIPVVVLKTLRETRMYKHRKKCKNIQHLYEDFIRQNEKLTSIVKKCLRLVQETELISRGFTLVSQKNPLSRMEGGRKDTVTRQCPVLRKLVFTVGREAVQFFREKTKNLFNVCPLSKELDIQSSYLAYELIQSYGPCLQTDIEDTETLYTITDGYSISALKGISHLLSLHQSEFIKALILVQQERFDKGNITSNTGVKELNIVESISAMLKEWTVSLQKSHDYHSCAWMNREPVTKPSRTQSNVEDIYVAVHSLDLHLQAALARVKNLSEHIQNLPDTGQTDYSLDDLLDKMQPIRAELESCKGCWEEGVNRIEKVSGKNSAKVECSLGNSQPDEETQSTDKFANTVEDYIIEDQVFEGYTDPDEVCADYEWERPLTAEEKEKKRKEKEEALRMLSELKSVISVRAVETERRENAAMLKMYPGHRVSEKLHNTEVDNQKVSGRPCLSVASSQDTSLSSYEHMTSKSCMDPVEGFQNKNSDEISRIDAGETSDADDSHADTCRLANTCSDIHSGIDCANLNDELKQGIADEVKHKGDTKCEEHIPYDLLTGRDKHSVISLQGVRRLRKGNMLELSDSDLEEYSEDESNGEYKSDEDEDKRPRLGLPLFKLSGDSYAAEGSASDGMSQFRLPVLKLGERLEHFSGANLGLTSEIATEAVAKSKIMGVMEETTFGGDVYGECSSSSDDGDEDDDDDDNNKKE